MTQISPGPHSRELQVGEGGGHDANVLPNSAQMLAETQVPEGRHIPIGGGGSGKAPPPILQQSLIASLTLTVSSTFGSADAGAGSGAEEHATGARPPIVKTNSLACFVFLICSSPRSDLVCNTSGTSECRDVAGS